MPVFTGLDGPVIVLRGSVDTGHDAGMMGCCAVPGSAAGCGAVMFGAALCCVTLCCA
jgi:hypothetical protein